MPALKPSIKDLEYRSFIVHFFSQRTDNARLNEIYRAALAYFAPKLTLRNGHSIKVIGIYGALRRNLQQCCSDCPHYKGQYDLVSHPRYGWWGRR